MNQGSCLKVEGNSFENVSCYQNTKSVYRKQLKILIRKKCCYLSNIIFVSFYRDLLEAVELNRKRETQKSECLKIHCKNVLLPDRLYEAVDRRVKIVPK